MCSSLPLSVSERELGEDVLKLPSEPVLRRSEDPAPVPTHGYQGGIGFLWGQIVNGEEGDDTRRDRGEGRQVVHGPAEVPAR